MKVPMLSEIRILDEPALEFRYGQPVTDPRDGLSLFGPYDADAPGHPGALSYGVVGTGEGTDLFLAWSSAMVRSWTDAPNNRHRLWPPYPGFKAAFDSDWRKEPIWKHVLDKYTLRDVAHRHDPYERVYLTVNQYLSAFEGLQKLDERVGVMVCVVPDYIYQTCRIKSRVTQPTGEVVSKIRRKSRKNRQFELFSRYEPEQYDLSLDFRRQIKARTMTHNVPIQIICESTLRLNDEIRLDHDSLHRCHIECGISRLRCFTREAVSHGGLPRPGKACAMSASLFVGPMPKAGRRAPPAPPRCSSTMGTAWCSWATTVRGTRRKTINTGLRPRLHTIY